MASFPPLAGNILRIRVPWETMSEIFVGGREVSLSVGNINDCKPSESAEKPLMLEDKAFELPP
jgi:hypothetical protein